jgi:hypothetical protein
MLTFEDFFRKKKIDLLALEKAEPALFSEFKTHYEQMGEKSFDHTKKFWFNKLRLSYHLAPEPKAEKVIIENQLAEQTITETLEEPAPPANVGFKPRFKAGMTKPAEKPEEKEETEKPVENTEPPTPAPALGFKPKFKAGVTKSAQPAPQPKPEEPKEATENKESPTPAPAMGFKPRFKAGVTKSAAAPKPEEPKESSENTAQSTPAPAMGFKPRFKAGVTRPASPTSDVKNPPAEESATVTPEVNEAAEKKDHDPPFEKEKAAAQEQADAMERTADQETPDEKPTQNLSAGKSAYKPRFNMKNMKPKDEK